MCATGKVKYTGTGAANLTANAEYDIIAFGANSTEAYAIIVDDNGDVFATSALNGSAFEVTQLTAPTVMIP